MASKKSFDNPYVGIEDDNSWGNLYNKQGDHSVIIKFVNPVRQYSADPELYKEFHALFDNIIKILGAGYVIQKQDIFAQGEFTPKPTRDFLDEKYNENFLGRRFTEITTYLIITRVVKKKFFSHSDKEYRTLHNKANKILDLLTNNKMSPQALNAKAISEYSKRTIAMDFGRDSFSINNFKANDDCLEMGGDSIKSISLVDIGSLDFPTKVSNHIERNDIGKNFPVDTMTFLHDIPSYKVLLYNQVIFIPDQRKTLVELDLKMRRHNSVPDAENGMSADDISDLLTDVAKHNQIVVYAHYNLIIRTEKADMDKVANFVESSLFTQGILPSRNAYNQLELFRAALPGNTSELQSYDKFLTTSDAGLCFFFKESLLTDEESTFQIYFSDRQGIPVAMDPTENPMASGKIANRNKFVLGPSGSGKSFFMNHLIRQYALYNTDIVLIDTGHSYSGICEYYGGRYITYTEEKPITMNPFRVREEDLNTEKKQFLQSLIGLLWKGTGALQPTEADAISEVITSYYKRHFDGRRPNSELNFNSFYEYSTAELAIIMEKHSIEFSLNNYKYLLRKFYVGGEYSAILNDEMDVSLLEEPFVVFEIDAIKEHNVLFPITTLIIMDVFTQKMRLRPNRKALIIEEAWKAIASPTMASYILYIWKTVRKFYGEAVVVTQELDDILHNPVLKDAILANSDTRCLLDQSKFRENYGEISRLLSLNQVEQNKIFTINRLDNREGRGRFKEVYVSIGGEGEVYGVENSLYEYLIFTTERKEKEAVAVYNAHYGSIKNAIERFVPDQQDSKLSISLFSDVVNATDEPLYVWAEAMEVYRISIGSVIKSVKPFLKDLSKSGLSAEFFCQSVAENGAIFSDINEAVA